MLITEPSYIGVSLIDNITTNTVFSGDKCSEQYTPKPIPQPTKQKIKTVGQRIGINFRCVEAGTYFIYLTYTSGGSYIEPRKTITTTFRGQNIRYSSIFVPNGVNYTYKVMRLTGSTTIASGSGQANGSEVGYANVNTIAAVASMAYVGKGSDFAYQTIQSAIDNSPSNTYLHIAPGIYDENIVINKPITILGPKDGVATILSLNTAPALLLKSNNVTIQRMSLQNNNSNGTGIQLENVSNCIIDENVLRGYPIPILLNVGCSGNVVNNNYSYGSVTEYGIYINTSSGNTISNNGLEFGKAIIRFINCNAEANTITGNYINTYFKKSNLAPILNLLLD